MKKIAVTIVIALCLAFVLASCGSQPASSSGVSNTASAPSASASGGGGRQVASAVPQFVKDAIMNAPEDALIGIGTYQGPMGPGRSIAATRARAEISRQMNTMLQDMVRDYTAMSEADPSAVLSFQEVMTVALSKTELVGSREVGFDYIDGVVWMVVAYGKNNIVSEINQAQAAAKLAPAAMASFDAEARMNAAFDKAYGSEIQVVSN